MKRIFFIIASLIISTTGFSQVKQRLTLQEAIDIGLKNSKQLQLDSAKKLIAHAKQKQLEDNQYPAVKASAGYSRLSNVPEFTLPGQTTSFFPNLPNQYSAGVRLVQPIFGGFRAQSALESGRFLEKAVEADAAYNKDEVAYNIISAYFNLYKQIQAKKLIDENLTVATSRLKDIQNFEKNGIAARNDVMRSELQVSNVELSKIDAENGIKIANFNMSILLGLAENTQIEIDSASLFSSKKENKYEAFFNDALANRKDVQAIGLRVDAANKNIKVSKAGYFPVISLQSGYLYANPNSRYIPASATFHSTWDIGLAISYDLSALFTNKHNVSEARGNWMQTKYTSNILLDKIKTEVNTSFIQYLQQKERIEVSKKALVQATENYRIVKNKYYNQVATLTDLLDADNLLMQTRLNLILNQSDLELSYKNILKTTGTIIE